MIAPSVIIIWAGTHAAIPSGFTRETSLDSKYPKATADVTDPNNTGGAATHTHSSPSHVHAMASHTHTFNLSTVSQDNSNDIGGDGGSIMEGDHSHSGTTGGSSGNSDGTALTYGAASNDPPYYEVIFIKPSTYKQIPSNALVLSAEVDIPSGFTECNGGGGTPDLRNKYIKGAGAGQNAGTTGGGYTNTHDISHSHTGCSHNHSASSSSSGNSTYDRSDGGSSSLANHSHSFSTSAATAPIDSYSGSLVTSETVEPAYKKVIALKNTSGGNKVPKLGMIGMWLGVLDDIPPGWFLCDGDNDTPDLRDKFIKLANDTSEIGNTGGANTHTHGAQSHSHNVSSGHTHGGSASHTMSIAINGVGSRHEAGHGAHNLQDCQSQTPTYGSTNTTADSSDNQPAFRTVAYIMFKFGRTGGGFPIAAL